MAVELAVLMPVVIVVALVVYNLARFVSCCAVFDRVALDAVLSQGVSPSGTGSGVVAVKEVAHVIEQSMGAPDACSVEVSAEALDRGAGRAVLSLLPSLTRFRCTLVFTPWPSSFVIAGVAYDAPLVLRHERTLVVDCVGTWVVR